MVGGSPVNATEQNIAISARNLGKRYRVAHPRRRDGDTASDTVAPLRETIGRRDWAWAIRHVDFEVEQGQVFGVLGRNGSGKTTLLKLLARVTAPTAGRAEVKGRVAALLQLGAGFHPELTGRENIALSGAVMGLTAEEVEAAFQDIVEFSEIGASLDEPVKHYSSGMNSRLAYAVSAFLPAEVMLIDEVLAVGDAAFKKKAHEHMMSKLQDGRTVLYVGHDLNVARRLCRNAIVLEKGRVVFTGSASDAADYYEHVVVDPRVRQRGR